MKKTKLSLLCAFLLNNIVYAAEELELLKVESSTINVHETKKNEVSASNIIDEIKIREINIKNINDVLKTIPGLTVSTRTGEIAQIHLRGVGQQQFMGENSGVAIIVDGVPVRQQAGGIRLNLKDIQSIKVVKGSASYLYGDTALAGALIITTKKAKYKDSIDLEMVYGSHNFKDTLLSLYKSDDNFAINLNGSYRDTDGYWKDSQLETKSINGKFTYFLDDSSDISLSTDLTDKYDQSGARAVVAGITEARKNPKGKGNSYTKDNNIDLDKYTLSYNKSFENNSDLLISTYLYKDFYKYLSKPHDFSDGTSKYTHKIQQNLKQYGLKTEYKIHSEKLATLIGLDLGKKEFKDINNTLENYSDYDMRKRKNVNYYDGENKITEDNEKLAGLYGEFKYSFIDKLTGTFNTRFDYQTKQYNVKEKDFDGISWKNKNISEEKSFRNMSYRFGLAYDLNKNNILFSSVSTAFETPDVTDLDSNPNVKEQRSINYELGFRGNESIYFYETSIFQINNKDIIGPQGGTYSFGDKIDNAGDTRSRGLELSLGSDEKKDFSFNLSYTYLENKYTKYNTFTQKYRGSRQIHEFNIVGNTVPRSSKHTINLRLNYNITNNLRLSSDIYAKSSYFGDETNLIKMPGYETLDLQARYKTKFGKNKAEFFVKAINVFDKQYFKAAYLHRDKRGAIGIDEEDLSLVVDPGREFYAGFKYSF